MADELEKKHHVSPLVRMDQTYTFRAGTPGERLALGLPARDPAMSRQVVAKIYAQAARLKLMGARHYPHPGEAEVAR